MDSRNDKQYDLERRNPKARDFYSSKEWKQTRAIVFTRDDELCVHCAKKGIATVGDVVHHIVELLDGKEGWDKRLDPDNLITLCHKHHNLIHKSNRKDLTKGIYFDEFGFPRKVESI